ncbi:low-density lipoprotein receptor-related protein 5-like [Littorina saxatilis]|uniref:low-density lipoprotein receptor-related protein 5-like n=1 Tax=Littorina saxatilis TaxID=31220 RepID=UPI0038B64976
MCQCHFGFQLGKDNTSCITDYAASDFFLVADKLLGQLYQVKRSTKSVSAAILPDGSIPEVVTFNPNTREIIWYDSRVAAIKLSSLNGSSANVVRTLKVANQAQPNTVGSLCVDQSTNNLFFTEISADNSQGWIRVISLERRGDVMRTLNRTIPPPRYLAIAPNAGILVFGTVNGTLHLTDMAMDGSSELLHSGVVNLSGLALTQDGSKVVWSDKDRDDITEMDLKTRLKTPRLTNSKSYPHSLQIWGSDLYYLTSSGRSIKSLKEDKENIEIEFPEFGLLTSLYFVGVDKSTDTVKTDCSIRNGRCSTLCLPTRDGGRRCQCTDEHHILEDKRTCNDVERCTAVVKNGQLSTSCDRYPSETCTYSCNEGYRTSPKASNILCKSTYHDWNVSLDSLCLLTCPKALTNGRPDDNCTFVKGNKCGMTCNAGYRLKHGSSTQIECGEDGEWKLTSETVCQAIESSDTQLPAYVIAIIIIGVVAVIVLLGGCFLYRRMKMYGGRNGRGQDLDLPPVLFTSHGNAVRPPKDGEDDGSHDYAELDDVANVSSYTRHLQLTGMDNAVYLDLLPAVIQHGEPSLPVSKRKTHLECRAPQSTPGNAANAIRSEYLTPGYLTKPVYLDSEAARSGGTEALNPSQAAAARGLSPLSNQMKMDCVPSGSGMLRKMDKFGPGVAVAAESDYLTAVPMASGTECLSPAQMSSRMGYLTASHM